MAGGERRSAVGIDKARPAGRPAPPQAQALDGFIHVGHVWGTVALRGSEGEERKP
jgi:hypothetical protein